jgi:hypothetical protein
MTAAMWPRLFCLLVVLALAGPGWTNTIRDNPRPRAMYLSAQRYLVELAGDELELECEHEIQTNGRLVPEPARNEASFSRGSENRASVPRSRDPRSIDEPAAPCRWSVDFFLIEGVLAAHGPLHEQVVEVVHATTVVRP